MLKEKKAIRLIAFFMGFTELLIILFAPNYFIRNNDTYSGIEYVKDYSFCDSFQLCRSNGFGVFCSITGVVFLAAIIIGMISNLAMVFAKDDNSNIAAICSSIAIGTGIVYPVTIAYMLGNFACFVDAEFGYVSFMLLILINMFSKKYKTEGDKSEEQKKTNSKTNATVNKNNKFNSSDNEYVDYICLNCSETVSFKKEELDSGEKLECPFCGDKIN